MGNKPWYKSGQKRPQASGRTVGKSRSGAKRQHSGVHGTERKTNKGGRKGGWLGN